MKTKQTRALYSLKIGVIGAGALGGALVQRLHQKGFAVTAVLSKTNQSAQRLASRINCTTAGIDLRLLQDCNFVLITVPDSQIRHVAVKLQAISFHQSQITVVHTSGTLTSSCLAKLKGNSSCKINTASMHPMQTFPEEIGRRKETLADQFRNIYFGVEGDAPALRIIGKIVLRIGGRTVIIPESGKALYHMGGVFSSNFMTALLYVARNLYAQIGLDEKKAFEILFPIMKQTMKNVKGGGVTASLTGPAARKDRAVIQNHLRALKAFGSTYQKVYAELTGICYALAESRNVRKKAP